MKFLELGELVLFPVKAEAFLLCNTSIFVWFLFLTRKDVISTLLGIHLGLSGTVAQMCMQWGCSFCAVPPVFVGIRDILDLELHDVMMYMV